MAIVEKGTFWARHNSTQAVRVLTEIEGYVIARYSGCIPFVRARNTFLREFMACGPVKTFRAAEVGLKREQSTAGASSE